MRTLASTFSTREEAEAARRRLESVGIASERITLKDVARAVEGPAAAAGSTGGAFISVKVTTDQVERASEILKGQAAGRACGQRAKHRKPPAWVRLGTPWPSQMCRPGRCPPGTPALGRCRRARRPNRSIGPAERSAPLKTARGSRDM